MGLTQHRKPSLWSDQKDTLDEMSSLSRFSYPAPGLLSISIGICQKWSFFQMRKRRIISFMISFHNRSTLNTEILSEWVMTIARCHLSEVSGQGFLDDHAPVFHPPFCLCRAFFFLITFWPGMCIRLLLFFIKENYQELWNDSFQKVKCFCA